MLPVYVRSGLAWEDAETAIVEALLRAPVFAGKTEPLVCLELTMRDVYPPTHWAIRGTPPAYDTPDADVYLTGRNLVLLTKAALVAATRGVNRIALGPLAGNPFPDARPEFFSTMSTALSLGLDHRLQIATPFLDWHKSDVIARGVALGVPLELSLSCMRPVFATAQRSALPVHCGLCSKCRERRDAFRSARVADPTTYASAEPR